MIIDTREYGGVCLCGREHIMTTRSVVIESGCLLRLEEILEQSGIRGKRCAIYGENSYAATADRHPRAGQEIVLPAAGLHADERSTARVLELLDGDVEVILAVGSGTIHDIARYCARERGLRLVSCPTAASVDGFCSTVSAMTWHGYKKTVPAVAPEIVVADTEIIRNAPPELVKSGVGDILAKYTALADWKIANVLTGEYFCPRIYDMMRKAVDTAVGSIDGLLRGETEAYTSVTYALVLSGIAMQMMGNSRPASGAEHHISHLIEMGPTALTVAFPALHGEKTGVGSVLAAREYKRLADIDILASCLSEYEPLSPEEINAFFGNNLAKAILMENRSDCLATVQNETLICKWPQIKRIIADIPNPEYLYGLLEMLDAKREPEDIGVTEDDVETIFEYSPLVRNRLTLMRIRRLMKRTGNRERSA